MEWDHTCIVLITINDCHLYCIYIRMVRGMMSQRSVSAVTKNYGAPIQNNPADRPD